MNRRVLVLAVWMMVASCGGSGAGLSETGRGLPRITLEFPPAAAPGSVQQAVLEVMNPGPGDIGTLIVAFTRAGDPDLPAPIVDVTGGNRPSAVRSVHPKPEGVSDDGVVYRFDGASPGEPFLAQGDSAVITFDLAVPRQPGTAANAVQVYDGSDIDRATGVRLETEVEG